MRPPVIVSWLWSGNTMGYASKGYTGDHVERLDNMLRRNLTVPYRHVCISDTLDAVQRKIERLRMTKTWPLMEHGRCYRRLALFEPETQAALDANRILSIDLDCVITGNIDHLLAGEEPFKIWKGVLENAAWCGSLWRLDAGYRPDVLSEFDADTARGLREDLGLIGSDQAWMFYRLGPDAPLFTRRDGVLSFRFDLSSEVPRMPGGFGWQAQKRRRAMMQRRYDGTLPKDARVVFFHGPHDPSMTHLHIQHPWIKEHWL
jgi:hypothetical protein